jgi:methionine-S-sulfoxide reductase
MNKNEITYLAGGCFWCLEAVFQRVTGVKNVRSGYSGGSTPSPTYEQVSFGETGHAEVVEISFDPNEISFENILNIFFEIHDPTTLNQQGADIGTQYRSMILVTSPEQFASSLKKIGEVNSSHKYQNPVVTEVVKFREFFEAENFHQNFYNNNPEYSYCRIVINPKLKKLVDIKKNRNIIL